MTSKLVYVLTCAPEANYIEQALMSVWSARHWNPDAHIVLITDNLTDKLFVGKRAEILDYISEKIVVPFEDASLSMMYRSRWLKTSVRRFVSGNYLFIDCDTIVQDSLSEIDNFNIEIGAVYDEHLLATLYPQFIQQENQKFADIIGYDYSLEKQYYNSGVMFVKDAPIAYRLYEKWHMEWMIGEEHGVKIDQASLGKVNMELGHVIQTLEGTWNCLAFLRPYFIDQAKIIHFWKMNNTSLIFTSTFLQYVKVHGVDKFVEYCIIRSKASLLPFYVNIAKMPLGEMLRKIKRQKAFVVHYLNTIDNALISFPWKSMTKYEISLLFHNFVWLSLVCYTLRAYINIYIRKTTKIECISFVR